MSKPTVGTVKWFSDSKGFGFIAPEGGGQELFAHFSTIKMEGFKLLHTGVRIKFELVDGPLGREAIVESALPPSLETQIAGSTQEASSEEGLIEPLLLEASAYLRSATDDFDQRSSQRSVARKAQSKAFYAAIGHEPLGAGQ